MSERLSPRGLKALIGREIGVSDWLVITQERINAFADCTEDRQWIHVDPAKAARGPLKSTVALGYLVLALITHWLAGLPLFQAKFKFVVNYGLDRVRFITPVKTGSRLRNRAVLREVQRKGFRRWLVKIENTVEIEGQEKPALVAELLGMFFL